MVTKINPFRILEMERAHQIPESPMAVALRAAAAGIRNRVNTLETVLEGTV